MILPSTLQVHAIHICHASILIAKLNKYGKLKQNFITCSMCLSFFNQPPSGKATPHNDNDRYAALQSSFSFEKTVRD
ncbi:hypothetical protein RchiOBHm_Chr2g0131801 [Rosa chinensis]|uniref:Uncharacterized protein n=1 Tax=Rosa chinensis TaxID=74649 RepID=A0A2P6RV61_ROSCH|nr:hypothetical protein RchiOBHm_Chr2g0131801 [Rosa chinensis]